jgi:hypothetical protein
MAKYGAIGGLLLGGALHFLGCGLYFYNDRNRWQWRGRRPLGFCVSAIGIATMVGGAWLSAANGGGY